MTVIVEIADTPPAQPTPIAPFEMVRTRRCLLPAGADKKPCISYLNHIGPCTPKYNVPALAREQLSKAAKPITD